MVQSDPSEINPENAIFVNNELQRLYDEAPCGYHSLDSEGRVVRVNHTQLRMLGYTREEMLGEKITKFLTEDTIKLFRTNFPQVIQGKEFNDLEIEMICKDGSILPVSATIKPIMDESGNFLMTHSATINISERKRLEKERQEAELEKQKLETALSDSSKQVKIILDKVRAAIVSYRAFPNCTWIYDYWSPGCENLLGYTPEELINDQNLWTSRVSPEDLKAIIAQSLEDHQQKRNSHLEYRFRHKDGSLLWIASSQFFEWDETNNYWVGTGVLIDITQRKKTEITLQQQLTREQLLTSIAQYIRQTLDLDQVLQRTVDQVRELLNADRVVIFRFQPDWTGEIITESVANGYPAILSTNIYDPCFVEQYIEPYRQGIVTTRTDFSSEEIAFCYRELMSQFQVKASLVVPILLPILQGEKLWGLLITHQCSAPRQWQDTEIELLKQLTVQISIAIQQSELYQKTNQELLERQKAEQALMESEQKLQAILEYAPAAIYVNDLENKYLLINRRCIERQVNKSEPILGKSIYDFWPKETADTFVANNLKVVESQQTLEVEEIVPHSDGFHTYISLKFPIYDSTGKIYAVGGIATDITDRKEAERKIAEQANLINITSDAIILVDLAHKILFWNQGAERLYGWKSEEVLGETICKILCKDNNRCPEILMITSETGRWEGELEKVTNTGQEIIVNSRWKLVYDDLNQPKSILIVDSNITEKKQLEKQFYQMQRLESLGTLASGIAHDLNNIFTPILGIVELLPLRAKNIDEQTMNLLKTLKLCVQRGTNLVQKILTFARYTEGDYITIQPQNLLLELVSIIEQTFPKSIEISLQISSSELWTISANPTQIYQVLMNLLVNARDAMSNGGHLTICAENRLLDQCYTQLNLQGKAGPYVVITIKDTGTGMPPEVLEHIFEPFFTTKEVGKGTGLGLSTVIGIVKNHGGFVNVSSQLGKGTQFEVFLPAIDGKINPIIVEETLFKGHGELILIVDDELVIQEITTTSLEAYNYRTLVASDGIEALSIYTEYKQEISVVLVDIMMPNLDGGKTIQILQKMNPRVKLIATSGLIANSQIALELGAKIFLLKPYTIGELLQTVHQILTLEE